jgi:hypothetical protein
MELTPRLISAVGALALLPIVIYALASGKFTPVTTTIALINLSLIVGSLLVMFGPSPDEVGHGTAH